MSNAWIALIAGIGLGAFIYSKVIRSSGNNVQNSLLVAGVSGGLIFLTVLIILNIMF